MTPCGILRLPAQRRGATMFLSRLERRVAPPPPPVDLTGVSALEQRGLIALAAQLRDPWEGYCSTPPLTRFHQSQVRNRYLRAASQVGKTMGCAREAWMYAGDCHPFRIVPRESGLGLIAVGALEGTPLKGVLTALWNTRPEHLIDWERTCWLGPHHTPTNLTIYLKNGSVIKIVSSKGGSTGAAGVQADWVWIDEPPRRDKFAELVARVTQTGGHIWLSFTPVDSEQDLSWLKLYLEGDVEKGIPPGSPGWFGINMELSTTSCPWMEEQDVRVIYDQTPGWIADQRLRGAWDTPPIDAYFQLDAHLHDICIPLDTEGLQVGAWRYVASGDHGELAAHEHFVFFRVRKCRDARRKVRVQIQVLTEYVSLTRTNVAEDAAGIKVALEKLAAQEGDGNLAIPVMWRWTADINSAGKLSTGVSVNDALSCALGMPAGTIKPPDKSAGSVERGLIQLRAMTDSRPCDFRIASGSTKNVGAPQMWRSLARHKGKEDGTKHAIDALRYGVGPYLSVDSLEVRDLPEPAPALSFIVPTRRG